MLKPEKPFVTVVLGETGVGKTYKNMQEIRLYLRPNPKTGKHGRKVIIYDDNNEYRDFNVKTLEPTREAIIKFVNQKTIEARRIVGRNSDGQPYSKKEKKEVVELIVTNFINGLIVLDDIDKYEPHSNNQYIMTMLLACRHSGCNALTSHQSWRKMSVTETENIQIIRLHKTLDSPDSISKEKQGSIKIDLCYIASIIVEMHYDQANKDYREKKITEAQWEKNKSYFLYINPRKKKIYPLPNKDIYNYALLKYFHSNKKMILAEIDTMVFEGAIESRNKSIDIRETQNKALKRLIKKYQIYRGVSLFA